MMKISSLIVLVCLSLVLNAQTDSTKLTAKFRFHDGIYGSVSELKQNKPLFVSADLAKNAIVTDNFIQLAPHQLLDVPHINCIVKDGVPYLYFSGDSAQTAVKTYYKLQIQGNICYFSYTTNELRRVPMNVFDPNSGRLIYTSYIQNREKTIHRYIFRFNSGEIKPLTRSNLLQTVADDKKLAATVADIKDNDDDTNSRLFKSVLVYNDRNPVFVRK